jgi:hypothetical protein
MPETNDYGTAGNGEEITVENTAAKTSEGGHDNAARGYGCCGNGRRGRQRDCGRGRCDRENHGRHGRGRCCEDRS